MADNGSPSMPPNLAFQAWKVALDMPCRRQRSVTTAPASASFKTPMICSSENRFQLDRPSLQWVGLQLQMEEETGVRSAAARERRIWSDAEKRTICGQTLVPGVEVEPGGATL